MVGEGHEIGNHGWQLQMAVLLPAVRLQADIAQADSVPRQFASPTWSRSSVGAVYSGDPQRPDVAFHVEHILKTVRPGAIVVLHDGIGDRVTAPELLRRVLPELALPRGLLLRAGGVCTDLRGSVTLRAGLPRRGAGSGANSQS